MIPGYLLILIFWVALTAGVLWFVSLDSEPVWETDPDKFHQCPNCRAVSLNVHWNCEFMLTAEAYYRCPECQQLIEPPTYQEQRLDRLGGMSEA